MTTKAKEIRVTPNNVGALGLWAEGLTGLPGWLGYTSNPGDGLKYHSNRYIKSWAGLRAGHMCASYLLGVIAGCPNGAKVLTDPTHWVYQMQQAVQVNQVEFGEGKRQSECARLAALAKGGREARAVGGR